MYFPESVLGGLMAETKEFPGFSLITGEGLVILNCQDNL